MQSGLLRECGLEKIKDQKLLTRIIDYCGGNPYLLQIFSHLVSGEYYKPEELLASPETGTRFRELLQAATTGLSPKSRSTIELLSVLRLPLDREQFRGLGVHFRDDIGPLLDRFLVVNDEEFQKFHVSAIVGQYFRELYPKSSCRDSIRKQQIFIKSSVENVFHAVSRMHNLFWKRPITGFPIRIGKRSPLNCVRYTIPD